MMEWITLYSAKLLQSLLLAAVLSVAGWLVIRKLFKDQPTSIKCLAFIGGVALVATVLPIQPLRELYVAVLAFGTIAVLDYLRGRKD